MIVGVQAECREEDYYRVQRILNYEVREIIRECEKNKSAEPEKGE
jgi:hypothetical protein